MILFVLFCYILFVLFCYIKLNKYDTIGLVLDKSDKAGCLIAFYHTVIIRSAALSKDVYIKENLNEINNLYVNSFSGMLSGC